MRSAAPAASRDTLVAVLRGSALEARRHAVSAGATTVELSEGDLELQAADAMTAQSRTADAINRLTAATQRWAVAERAARDRQVAADARRAEPVSAPLPSTPTVPPASVAAPTTSSAVANVTAAPPAPTAAESRQAIDRVIEDYRAAIESMDVARVRRIYPAMTPQRQASWEAFFRSARNFRATFTTMRFEPADDRASVDVAAVYEYENRSTSRSERNDLTLHFTVVRDPAGAWRLSEVR